MTKQNNVTYTSYGEVVTYGLNCDYCNDVFYSDNAFARLCPKCYEKAKHTTREENVRLRLLYEIQELGIVNIEI